MSWEFESPPLHLLIVLYLILFAAIAQLVERDLAKVEVAGPSPVCRSSFIFVALKQKIEVYFNEFIS